MTRHRLRVFYRDLPTHRLLGWSSAVRNFFACHATAKQRNLLLCGGGFLLLLAASIPAHAQGCAQCLDGTRATPPAVQAAYRHAIFLLGGFAAALFAAGALLLHRERR
jgi:hypothetical protein